jgi:type VI protein secretion system component Hcp
MSNPKKLSITLLAPMFLLLVSTHGKRCQAFSLNQQVESRIRVTIPGVPGGGLSNTIDAYGYSGGILLSPSGSPTFEDFSITKGIDKATPLLSQKVAQGINFGGGNQIKVEVYRVDPTTQVETLFLKITMTGVRITSCKPAADSLSSLSSAKEQMTLCYGKITYEYRRPGEASIIFMYDRMISC